ncbi:MAG: mechanosensitive ion channel domain-containing protein [Verrucomicrobiota bacterium]
MSLWNHGREWVLHTLESTETHELFFAGLFLALALIIPWIANQIIGRIFRRLFRKLDHDLIESTVLAVKGPLAILIFVTFAVLALDQFDKIPKGFQNWSARIEIVLNGIAILVFAFRLVDIAAILFKRKMMQGAKSSLDDRWVKIIVGMGRAVVLFIGVVSIMDALKQPILPYLASAGVFGAAFALAAQSTLGNIIGSFEIMMDRLFSEGDRIAFGDYDGFVIKMGLRSVQITALSGEKITLPNKDLVDKQIRNLSKGKLVFGKVSVGLEYRHTKEDIHKAINALLEIARAHSKIKEASAVFRNLAASSLDIDLYFWAEYKTGGEYVAIISDLNMEIKERFDREGLSFAFPSSSVYLKKE